MTETEDIKPGQGTPSRPITPLSPRKQRTGMMILGGLLALSVLIPFWFWRGTWFGRPLNPEQMAAYLADDGSPRHIQHALSQIADRIIAGEPGAREWYNEVRRLAGHSNVRIRSMAAWVMGQDNGEEPFHEALLKLLDDDEPVVRRNAALQLVRFNDRSGKPAILRMLEPFLVRAPARGTLHLRLETDDFVDIDTLLGRLEQEGQDLLELRSPLPGQLQRWLAEDGMEIFEGQELAELAPADAQVREALRALVLIGEREDLPAINRIAAGAYDLSPQTRQQALYTAEAIQRR